ncbi:MAG: NTP transferase domain-containing protein [Ignavibacteriae bacterium]|nr:NTP transferase domain-containing protein [Ignavibacteriota bacterium]
MIINKVNNLAGIIITAGFSSRMGEFKPLLIFNDKSFLQNIIEKLDLICEKIIVVTGFKENEILKHVSKFDVKLKSKIEIIRNENYEMGMFTSLQKGLQKINSDWVIYHFVDQPHIPNKFYGEYSNIIDKTNDWIQPINKGRNGHPIIFNHKVSDIIVNSNQNSNLRNVTASDKINKYFWECDYQEILTDIDTPNDYEKLKGIK